MSIYLTRTVLLSLGIGIFVTVCFYVLRKDLKLSPAVKFRDPKETYSAEYTIRANGYPSETSLQQEFKNAMQVNIAATTERLDKADYDGKVKRENDSTYTISVRNITDTNAIRDLVSINSSISFNEVYTLGDVLTAVSGLQKEWVRFSNEKAEDTLTGFFGNIFTAATVTDDGYGRTYQYPYLGFIDKAHLERVLKMLSDSAVLRKFPANVQFALGEMDYNDRLASRYQLLYALKKNPDPISNKNIVEARAEADHRDNSYVSLLFDAAGARRWERITERNVGRAIAISINDKVIIAPNVLQKIIGGNSQISMSSEENCRVVSVLLTSSELKLPVRIVQSQLKREGKFSPKVLTGYINYILLFILSFAISFCVIWFVFKPGKKLSRNA